MRSNTSYKILLANKYFYVKGGSERVMFDEKVLLEEHGHEIVPFAMHDERNEPTSTQPYFVSHVNYDEQKKPIEKIRQASRLIYNLESKRKITKLIGQSEPQIAHLHNIYHQLSPSIIDALRAERVPTVMTLHDYKLVCPTHDLFADEGICEECGGGSFYHCAIKKCSKSSVLGSAVNSAEMYFHRFRRTYERGVDQFISPSKFLIQKLGQMGFSSEKVVHLPNFIDHALYRFDPNAGENDRLVYFGRLSVEKGLDTLLTAISGLPEVKLDIVGEGPLRRSMEQKSPSNVRFLGLLKRIDVARAVANAAAVVLPSECYENCPMTVLEAFAMGKPVIASRIGGIPELVEDELNGLLFDPGNADELQERISTIVARPDWARRLGRAGRKKVEDDHSPDAHYERLIDIYKRIL